MTREPVDRDYLTSREREVLTELAKDGASNKVLAQRMGISESTLKFHLSAAMKVAGTHTRVGLVLWWIRTGQPYKNSEETT
jgi:LuxR family maltose regulon positive regulatory protein